MSQIPLPPQLRLKAEIEAQMQIYHNACKEQSDSEFALSRIKSEWLCFFPEILVAVTQPLVNNISQAKTTQRNALREVKALLTGYTREYIGPVFYQQTTRDIAEAFTEEL